jgi:hypothetical protein
MVDEVITGRHVGEYPVQGLLFVSLRCQISIYP